jgi:hypothetical protein
MLRFLSIKKIARHGQDLPAEGAAALEKGFSQVNRRR